MWASKRGGREVIDERTSAQHLEFRTKDSFFANVKDRLWLIAIIGHWRLVELLSSAVPRASLRVGEYRLGQR